ncbi:hypothetical protein M9435_004522 [Picochlorum sp. BPE23]|nr:hypothetical protein M9435_004522 [Picochlorum sp. BPE23]
MNMVSATGMDAIQGLEPRAVWEFFDRLSSIPRPSFHEERVLEWLKEFAQERGLTWDQDKVGNLVIRHPGTQSGVEAPTVIIQGHVDMVTEKDEGSAHDFMSDPIKLIRDGDWITADGTTLGADNGLGVVTALAVLDTPKDSKDVLLPPIEALFTVAEETGLVGAFELDGSMLTGKTLLNLDTEDWPDIFIGCAGGGDSLLTLDMKQEHIPKDSKTYALKISGLAGGHSGLNISDGRANAVKIAADLLDRIHAMLPHVRVCSFTGGDKRNALPREATLTLQLTEPQATSIKAKLEEWNQEYLKEFGSREPEIAFELTAAALQSHTVLVEQDIEALTTMLLSLPHGVIKNSHAIDGLVETSNNVASVKMTPGDDATSSVCVVQCSTRSSIGCALERVRRTIRRIGEGCGADVQQKQAYPGWQPNPSAKVVQLCKDAITTTTGTTPELKAVHAGLECGILGERIPGVECVSFGPTIRGAHSPDERVQISTVEPFWKATLALLERLATVKVQ